MPTTTQVRKFELEGASLAQYTLAMLAQLENYANFTWEDARGAGFEGTYNALVGGNDKPAGGEVSKDQMNNAISAMKNILTAIEANTAAISVLAQFTADDYPAT